MSRFILAIAILIPLATVLFVTMNSNRDKEGSQQESQAVDPSVDDDQEIEKHFTVEITGDNFGKMVRESDEPVVLDFWAPWCGPCMMLGPHLEKVAADYEGLAVVGKINVDEQEELKALYEADSIPLILILMDGEIVKQFVGFDNETTGKIREALDGMIEP